jgi:sulfite oxidase
MKAYGANIRLAIAIDPRGYVLLAFEMNGKPLPCDHGFPARSVKWVNKIVVSDEGSNTTWQRRDYKCFGPNEKAQDWGKHKAIQEMPITSAITRVRQKPTSYQSDSRPSGCVGESSIRGTCLDSNSAYTRRGGQIVELEAMHTQEENTRFNG